MSQLKGKLTSKGTLRGHLSVGKIAEDYEKLKNLPLVNGVTLIGDQTSEDLGITEPVNADWEAVDGLAKILNKPAIPAAQVNSDWNAVDGVAKILNKPAIPAPQVNSDWEAVDGVAKILNKPTIPAAQIQSDWNQTDDGVVDYIKNKPTIPAAQVNSDWDATDGVAKILNKPTIYTQDEVDDIVDGLLPVDEADGSIVTFTTDLAKPLVSLKADINAVQDLHGQSGAYIAGGQLWDETWELGAWSSATGGPVNYTDRIRCKNLIPVQASASYCIRLGTTATCIVNAYDTNGDFIENIVNGTFGTGGRAFTTSATCAYIKFSCGTAYGTTYKNDISVNYPSTDTAYHPYSNICPIYGWNAVKVKKYEKNMLDISDLLANGITISGNEVNGTAQAFHENFGVNTNGIPNLKFKPNTQYTIAYKAYTNGEQSSSGTGIYWFIYYTDGTRVSSSVRNDVDTYTEFTFLTAGGKTIQKICISYGSANNNIWHIKDIQIEEGSSATAYEAYTGTTEVINLGDTYYGGELTEDADGHRQFKITHKKYIFNGTEVWTQYSEHVFFTLALSDALYADGVYVKCSNYIAKVSTSGSDITNNYPNCSCCVQSLSLYKRFYIKDNNVTLSNIQSQTTGITVIYPLDTPTVIDLSDGTPFTTLIGTNNIFADSGDVEVKFKESIQKYIDDKIAETQALIL